MCSACTSSSPPAVNSAAEQSARSLMFGLNAARCSTAPISSAIPGQPRDQHLQRRRHRSTSRPRSVAGQDPGAVGGRGRRSSRRGPRRCSRARRRPRGRRRASRGHGGSSAGSSARRAAGPGAERDDLDRDVRARRSRCAARARRGTPRSPSTVSSWLWPAYRQSRNVSTSTAMPGEPVERRHLASERVAGRRDAGVIGRVGPRPHELPLRRRRHQPDRGEHARPRRHQHRAHLERVGDRARVQRSRATERHQRELARVDAPFDGHDPHRAFHVRVDHPHDPLGGQPAPDRSRRAPRRRRAGRARGARSRPGCARARGRRR